ncbi:MAG: M24 family metallopeptidase [Candidatus Bathyarchaeia archaeon]
MKRNLRASQITYSECRSQTEYPHLEETSRTKKTAGITPYELITIYRREFETSGFPEHSASSFADRGYRTRQTMKTEMIGHGIGILGIEPLYLTEDNGAVLEAGMCFTLEPAIHGIRNIPSRTQCHRY